MSKRQQKRARALGAEIDRLLAGKDAPRTIDGQAGQVADLDASAEELAVARCLHDMVASFPPVPGDLEQRVEQIVRSGPVCSARYPRRWGGAASGIGTAALGALATVVVFLVVLFVVPTVAGEQRSWAQVVDILLGQTRLMVTPTLEVGPTFVSGGSGLSMTREPGATEGGRESAEEQGLPHRELLRDLVAAELLIGRAPATPSTLPEGYALQEIAAVSYPDLPSWISQPFYVELDYGPGTEGASPALRLRQYRLLFREFGGISGIEVAGDAVKDMEQVDIKGATGMLLTLDQPDGPPSYTVLWERDGLLLELKSDSLSQERLLKVARSVR